MVLQCPARVYTGNKSLCFKVSCSGTLAELGRKSPNIQSGSELWPIYYLRLLYRKKSACPEITFKSVKFTYWYMQAYKLTMKISTPVNKIIFYSILFSVLTIVVSFISININNKSGYIILEILGYPASIALMFAYFSGDDAFYLICFIEFISFFITYCMILHFYYVIKRERKSIKWLWKATF